MRLKIRDRLDYLCIPSELKVGPLALLYTTVYDHIVEVRKAIKNRPEEWWIAYHFNWGMSIRNLLRQNGFGEDYFSVENLDDIYAYLVEDAVQEAKPMVEELPVSTNVERLKVKIATAVITFVKRKLNETFTAQELRTYVGEKTLSAPSSADRVMRDLRKRGELNYELINRAQSLYRALPLPTDAP